MTITAKTIYDRISGMNAATYNAYGTKYGGYVSPLNESITRQAEAEVNGNLPEGTLAYNIYNDRKGKSFSPKQMWVIAYELMKNEAYVHDLRRRIIEENAEMEGCTVEEWIANYDEE